MKDALSAIFKIRKGEGRKVFQFVALFLLIQAGTAIGITTADSLFLLNVGAENLPNVFILVPVAMLIYIPVNSFLTARFGITRVFYLLLLSIVVGGVAFWLFLGRLEGIVPPSLVLYAARIYAAVCFIALYSLLWNFTYQYFNILDGKRLFAFFTGGQAVGAIIGGLLINLLAPIFPVANLFLVWAGLALLALPFLAAISRGQQVIETDEDEPDDNEKKGFVAQTLGLARIIASSRYVLLLLLVLFLAQVLTTLLEFQYLDILSTNTTEAELAALFGKLYIGVNIFNLVISLFVFNRMVLRFGVRNIALIQPVVYTFAFSWLFLDYGFSAGLFGFFAYQGLMVAIDYDNTNLLLNALPAQAKVQVRTFIEGMAEPLATATTGFFLLFCGGFLNMETISLIGIGAALVYLVSVLFLRYNYLEAMVTNLKRSWLDFSRSPEEVVTDLGPEELECLELAANGDVRELVPTALRILWINDRQTAGDAVLKQLSKPLDEEQREEIEPFFGRLVNDGDTDLFRRVIEWLERDNTSIDLRVMQEVSSTGLSQRKRLSQLLQATGAQEQATAALFLLKSWRLEDRTRGLSIFESLVHSGDAGASAAINAIGKSNDHRLAHFVAPFLRHRDENVRREAFASIQSLVGPDSSRLLPYVLEVISSGAAESRLAAFDALIKIGNTDAIGPMLRSAGIFTPQERRRAAAVIEAAGLRGVPMAVSVVRDLTYPFRGRLAAAYGLSRLAFPQFEETYPGLIRPELERAYQALYCFSLLDQFGLTSPGLEVLRQLFLDMRMVVVDFVLELHSIAGRLPAFELLSASLRSDNSKEIGDAIETIEQGVSREVFSLLLPLIDSRSLDERIRFYQSEYSPEVVSPERILINSIESTHSLISAAAAQALWEIGSPEGIEKVRDRFQKGDSEDFRDIVLSMLGSESGQLNLVGKIHQLLKTDLFRGFGGLGLEQIARNAVEERLPVGSNLSENDLGGDSLICVVSGAIQYRNRSLIAGAILGEEELFGSQSRKEAIVLKESHVLKISRKAILENTEIFPHTALRLLEFSLLGTS